MSESDIPMIATEIIGLYLKEANSRAVFINIISKDWHQFMERDIHWRYLMLGVIATMAEIKHGHIPRYLL